MTEKKPLTLRDMEPSRPLTPKQQSILANLDPDKPLDQVNRRADTKVRMKDECDKGLAVPMRRKAVREAADMPKTTREMLASDTPAFVGGPQTRAQAKERVRSNDTMRHIYETGRLPTKPGTGGLSSGRVVVAGFRSKDGSVPAFMDHPPFKPKPIPVGVEYSIDQDAEVTHGA